MANYSVLLADIASAIYENHNNEIDALDLKGVLDEMVASLGDGYLFKDVAGLNTDPGTPDTNVFYVAYTPGTYTHFGLSVSAGEVAFFCWDGTWTKKVTGAMSAGAIVDNLTTNDATKPLSAKQGKVLKDAQDATNAEVAALGQEVYGQSFTQPTLSDVLNGYLSGSAVWNAGVNYSMVLQLVNLAGFHISGTAVQYAFLAQWMVEGVISPAFVSGGGRVSGSLSNVEIPADAKYLYIYLGRTQPTSVPTYTFAETLSLGISGLQSQIDDAVTDIDKLEQDVAGINTKIEPVTSLGWGVTLPGTSFVQLGTNIQLSQNGDSLECELDVQTPDLDGATYDGYGFAHNANNTNGIGIAISAFSLFVRSDDNVWLIQDTAQRIRSFKIDYVGGNINFYTNGVLRGSYTGQKTITIDKFGKGGNNYGYWKGIIKKMSVNGTEYNFAENDALNDCTLYRATGLLTEAQNARVLPPIVISPVDSTHFNVNVLNASTGKYLTHTFIKNDATRVVGDVTYTTEDTWTTQQVKNENGDLLYQGNLNFIYRIGKVNGVAASDASVNEDYHVGISHGCEVAEFYKFFADGMPFDPATLAEPILCSSFRFIQKSKCYVVDSSINTGDGNNYPKIVDGDMVVHAIHYLDAVYSVDNIIKWYNRLTQVRNAAVQYEKICGGMVQGQLDFNNNILLNDVDNSWNEVADGGSEAVYSIPSGYDSQSIRTKTLLANVVIMWGDKGILRQTLINEDNAMQGHSCIYTQSNTADTAKCYQNAVRTIYLPNPDTLNEGDVISVYMERKIEVAD